MLSDNTIKQIALMFCGDTEGYYSYKSGPKLVEFFNTHYSAGDRYGQGFPSRWSYVYDKLISLLNSDRFDSFLNVVLSKEYLMTEQNLSMVEAVNKIQNNYRQLNELVQKDLYLITQKDGRFHLVKENGDLEFIGSGGFANVYKQKSTGHVMKVLKEDYLTDSGIRSRFKREFDITKSLQDSFGIIRVYSYDAGRCSYTMEYAETTLEKYVRDNVLSDEIKLNCIRQILYIMSEVHKKDIIHRDISPNNIFIVSGQLKIADFGLGKDLNVFTSHQTIHTNAVGQYYYCAPEQFMMLKDGDKRSDVYSLGRVINFIMTGNPMDSHHIHRSVAEKASNNDAAYRYGDAIQLSNFFEKSVEYHNQTNRQEEVEKKIRQRTFDTDVESYIYDMSAEKISKTILSGKTGFIDVLIAFMKTSEDNAQHVIQSVEKSFRDVCGRSYEANDPFALFASKVLSGPFPFVVKEIAANILHHVAWEVNRFSAQHLVESIIDDGIEPMLEDIIRG